jgi:hypothetical protein
MPCKAVLKTAVACKKACKKKSVAIAKRCRQKKGRESPAKDACRQKKKNKKKKKPVACKQAVRRRSTVVRTTASIGPGNHARPGTFSKVYVLQLRGGCVYVGKTSRSLQMRLGEHMQKRPSSSSSHGAGGGIRNYSVRGCSFAKLHPPTGKFLPRLGNLEGEGDGPERDETLRQMFKRGTSRVRGWKYVRPGPLTMDEIKDVECNIRELFDLCRRCGKKGHFTARCRETSDRNGVAVASLSSGMARSGFEV